MLESNVTSYIAWWGAGLSTLLAFLKIHDIWNNRFRIVVAYKFTSDPELGNEIIIRNLSSKPAILEHWELYHCTNRLFFKRLQSFESASFDIQDIQIQPHSSKTLSFTGPNYFSSSPKILKGRAIYIKLFIVGKKPFLKKVFK